MTSPSAPTGGSPKTRGVVLVPTTVQHELYMWVKREPDENTALDTIALAEDGLVVPLSTDIALAAADLTLSHQLALPIQFIQRVSFVISSVVRRTYVMSASCDTARRQGPGFILILRIPAFSVMDAELSARAKKMAPHLLDNAQTRPRASTSLAVSPCSYMRSW
jgi:hypothetical protein